MTFNVIIANDTQPNLPLSDIQGIKIWRHHFFGFGALDSVFRPGAELVLIFFLNFFCRWRYQQDLAGLRRLLFQKQKQRREKKIKRQRNRQFLKQKHKQKNFFTYACHCTTVAAV